MHDYTRKTKKENPKYSDSEGPDEHMIIPHKHKGSLSNAAIGGAMKLYRLPVLKIRISDYFQTLTRS